MGRLDSSAHIPRFIFVPVLDVAYFPALSPEKNRPHRSFILSTLKLWWAQVSRGSPRRMPAGGHCQARGEELTEQAGGQHSINGGGPCCACLLLNEHHKPEAVNE